MTPQKLPGPTYAADRHRSPASPLRSTVIMVAGFGLVLVALCEVVLAYPVARWLYVCLALIFTGALIRFAPPRAQLARIGALATIISVIALLYFIDWTSRKPFLRDLARVRVGMTESQVRRIMDRYVEGTGWPAPRFHPATNESGISRLSSDSRFRTTASPSDELVISDSLVFRHSTHGTFNSDWGIVSFSSGIVVSVEFSAD